MLLQELTARNVADIKAVEGGMLGAVIFFGLPLIAFDLRSHRLPNWLVTPFFLTLFLFTLALSSTTDDWPRFGAAVSAAIGTFTLYAIAGMIGLMGFGDVKLAGVLGLWLGWYGADVLATGMLAAFVLALPQSIVMTVRARRGEPKKRLAFGPYMLAGAVLVVLWAPAVQFMAGASLF